MNKKIIDLVNRIESEEILKIYLANNEIEALNDMQQSFESDIGIKKTTYYIIIHLIVRLIKIITK